MRLITTLVSLLYVQCAISGADWSRVSVNIFDGHAQSSGFTIGPTTSGAYQLRYDQCSFNHDQDKYGCAENHSIRWDAANDSVRLIAMTPGYLIKVTVGGRPATCMTACVTTAVDGTWTFVTWSGELKWDAPNLDGISPGSTFTVFNWPAPVIMDVEYSSDLPDGPYPVRIEHLTALRLGTVSGAGDWRVVQKSDNTFDGYVKDGVVWLGTPRATCTVGSATAEYGQLSPGTTGEWAEKGIVVVDCDVPTSVTMSFRGASTDPDGFAMVTDAVATSRVGMSCMNQTSPECTWTTTQGAYNTTLHTRVDTHDTPGSFNHSYVVTITFP